MLHAAVLIALLACVRCGPAQEAPMERPTLVLRQSGDADVVGADDVAIKAACDRLRKSGGTLVLGPGRYVMRRSVFLPANFVLRGEEGAVLALPSPALTAAAAAAGAQALVLDRPHELAANVLVQILPPVGTELFPDGETRALELQQLVRVEGQRIFLRDPLPVDVPAGSRVGYPLKVFQTHRDGLATLENLVFEGGRIDSIPMPGHSQRCALWASAPYGDEEKRKEPPGRGVIVRNCRFTDWYGRAVALYRQVDGRVEGCRFERIADEAIDLDHFTEGFTVRENDVRDARFGIVLNDASRNLVERNTIQGGEIGIWSWWYEETPRQGINEENVIRANTVRGTAREAIRLDATCVRYLVEQNTVEGEIVVIEPENTVRDNVRLDAPGAGPKRD